MSCATIQTCYKEIRSVCCLADKKRAKKEENYKVRACFCACPPYIQYCTYSNNRLGTEN